MVLNSALEGEEELPLGGDDSKVALSSGVGPRGSGPSDEYRDAYNALSLSLWLFP